jgi:hypothetical protein
METTIISEIPKSQLADFVDALPEFHGSELSLMSTEHQMPVNIDPIHVDLERGSDEDELEADFQDIRKNLAEISARSVQVIDDLLVLSKQSESPRSYEVLVSAINSLAASNKDLLDAHSKRADIKKKLATVNGNVENQTNVQNNNVFVGSTSELLEMLSKGK